MKLPKQSILPPAHNVQLHVRQLDSLLFLEDRNMATASFPHARSQHGHEEGALARAIEEQTAKLPSDTFLWAAVGSIGLAMTLQAMGRSQLSNFVGHWAPTFLLFGIYNKIVKVAGSDSTDQD
jgi:hypothetical protein